LYLGGGEQREGVPAVGEVAHHLAGEHDDERVAAGAVLVAQVERAQFEVGGFAGAEGPSEVTCARRPSPAGLLAVGREIGYGSVSLPGTDSCRVAAAATPSLWLALP
jgi:hypothetical protein